MATKSSNAPLLHRSLKLPASAPTVYKALTTAKTLSNWLLADRARVQPRVGGAFEVFWLPDSAEDSTAGCTVLAMQRNQMLATSWKAPTRFKPFQFANDDPLTTVTFILSSPSDETTLLNLLHSGFRSGGEWAAVTEYFDEAWRVWLNRLRHVLEGASDEKTEQRLRRSSIKQLYDIAPMTEGPVIEGQF